MRIAIHQPQYLPWCRYIHKVLTADVFVYLDTVQFSKNGVQNRNQLKTQKGATWITLPVQQQMGQSIKETRIADVRSFEKHYRTIEANYAKTPGFQRWKTELRRLYQPDALSLCDFSIQLTEWMLSKLNANSRRIRASEIPETHGSATELVASICAALGADVYLTGTGALDYMDYSYFRAIGCSIQIQTWNSFEYSQNYAGIGFLPDLSTMDLMLNCPDSAGDLILTAGDWESIEY